MVLLKDPFIFGCWGLFFIPPSLGLLIFAQNLSIMADPKKRKFLNLPQYPGGKTAYSEFLRNNLKYPKEALDAQVEGTVIVEFDIDDNGKVHQPRIIKGIGHGCDEEAVRVVNLLRYQKVKNMGVRVRSTTKTNIHFKLPTEATLNYSITTSAHAKQENKPDEAPKQAVVYNYTIEF